MLLTSKRDRNFSVLRVDPSTIASPIIEAVRELGALWRRYFIVMEAAATGTGDLSRLTRQLHRRVYEVEQRIIGLTPKDLIEAMLVNALASAYDGLDPTVADGRICVALSKLARRARLDPSLIIRAYVNEEEWFFAVARDARKPGPAPNHG